MIYSALQSGDRTSIRVRTIRTLILMESAFILFSSCIREEEVDFNYQNLKQKLTVECYLCPQFDTIFALVTRTINWGEWLNYQTFHSNIGILDAVVSIARQNSDWTSLKACPGRLPIYTISTKDLPIIPGEKYLIRVTAPGYQTVIGSTVVPDTLAYWMKLDTLGRTLRSESETGANYAMRFYGEWKEVDPELRYYVTDQSLNYIDGSETPIYGPYSSFVNQGQSDLFYPSSSIRKYGLLYNISMELELSNLTQRFYFFLISGNSEFFNYLSSVEPYHGHYNTSDVFGSSAINDGIPKYFTNLSGGFGVFAAFRYRVDSIDIIR